MIGLLWWRRRDGWRRERLEIGVEHLKGWGLEVEVMPSVLAGHERFSYLAADDKARAEDLRSGLAG